MVRSEIMKYEIKIVLVKKVLLRMHVNFMMWFSISAKKIIGTLNAEALNL